MAETSSLLNCRRGNSTASSNLVLSANQDHNGCDESRNRFFVDTPTQARLQLVVSARKRLHPQGAVAAMIGSAPAGARKMHERMRVNLVLLDSIPNPCLNSVGLVVEH